jgi:hypothetical protein
MLRLVMSLLSISAAAGSGAPWSDVIAGDEAASCTKAA